ncbi:MAG: hypothetical protein BWY55_00097 [archaeon ADurb.Bin336]|nr:MAG: hypothetical protein BWY55_00097 [archaeon ADurb.Bin336]
MNFLVENIFENKQLLVVLLFWFVFSFLVLWFIGGGCLSPMDGGACISSGAFDWMSTIPVLNLLMPFGKWSSLMYFFAPIAGFILAFGLINWWNSYFETKEASGVFFLVLILVALFLGYYINLFFYVNEAASIYTSRYGGQAVFTPYFCFSEVNYSDCASTVSKLNEEFISQLQSGKVRVATQYIPVAFWSELRRSMYLLFILGAINAWVFLFASEVYKSVKESKE